MTDRNGRDPQFTSVGLAIIANIVADPTNLHWQNLMLDATHPESDKPLMEFLSKSEITPLLDLGPAIQPQLLTLAKHWHTVRVKQGPYSMDQKAKKRRIAALEAELAELKA